MEKQNDVETVLAVSARPRRFKDVIGQETMIHSICSRVSKKRMPKAWMFSGPSGGGKTTIARILAVSLQQENYDDFGNPPDECTTPSRMKLYDIHEINAALHNKVNQLARRSKQISRLYITEQLFKFALSRFFC